MLHTYEIISKKLSKVTECKKNMTSTRHIKMHKNNMASNQPHECPNKITQQNIFGTIHFRHANV